MLKILATADVHVGMKFGSYGAAGATLAEARFAVLETIVAHANETACDILVCAGDVFESVRVSQRDVKRVAAILSGFDGRVAAVLPGNHDFFNPELESLWQVFRENAGDKVIVLDTPEPYDLDRFDCDAVILPAPCTSKHSSTPATEWISTYERTDERPVIGVAHGSIDGLTPDTDGRYFPMQREDLLGLPVDVWIIGHTHAPYPTVPEGRLYIPGTPEPDGFDCGHLGSVVECELDRRTIVRSAFVRTGRYRFVRKSITIDRTTDSERVRAEILGTEISGSTLEVADRLYRIELSGTAPRSERDRIVADLEELESAALYAQIKTESLRPDVDPDELDTELPNGSFAHAVVAELLAHDRLDAANLAFEIARRVRS